MTKSKYIESEVCYGVHPIKELLYRKQRKLYVLYTTKPTPGAFSEIEPLLSKGTQIQYVSREVLTKIAESPDHQGVVARVQLFPFRKKMFDPQKEPVLLLLDSIQDPRNIGAIIRTAVCTGINGIIIPIKSTAPLTATVHKSAAGLAERISIMHVSSSSLAVEQLKKAGYMIYLTTIEGRSITEVSFQKPLCLVIGNEAVGVSKALYKYGEHVALPQSTDDISYNASVAAGIFMFHIMNVK